MELRVIGWKVVDSIYLAEDSVGCRAVVNKVMNLTLHKMCEFVD
jgi:hypothetical protein